MSNSRNLKKSWQGLCDKLGTCRICKQHGLLHPKGRPLVGRFKPRPNGILFIFEAPNLRDTTDPQKGFITVGPDTDDTGKFAYDLMTEILEISPAEFQVTNSVLCLPDARGVKFPVRGAQARFCSEHIRRQIETIDPVVVASVGGKALKALCQIEDHGYPNMSGAVARPAKWFGRWLFPLYHTGLQARNGPSGRDDENQRKDWAALRKFHDSLTQD